MATPDYEYVSDYIDWSIQPDYTVEDQQFACSMTGLPKKPGEVVYRGNMIEEEGYFTISQYSAEQLARLIGWVDPGEEALAAAVVDDLRAQVEQLQRQNRAYETAIRELVQSSTERPSPEQPVDPVRLVDMVDEL